MLRKLVLLLVTITGSLYVAETRAATLGYLIENGGDTWTLGSNYVGLLGFSSTAGGQTVTEADILGDIQQGQANRVVGIFNGVDNLGSSLNLGSGTVADYESNTFFSSRLDFATGDNLPFSNGLDPFTSVDLAVGPTRFVSVAFVVFEGPGSLVFDGGVSGTATLTPNGNRGEFPAPFVPEPGAAGLAVAMAATMAARRRSR